MNPVFSLHAQSVYLYGAGLPMCRREAMKMQKTFRIKCKEMIVLDSSKRYEGVIDDPDMNAWPAPLKIGHQVIESMKEFRVRPDREDTHDAYVAESPLRCRYFDFHRNTFRSSASCATRR